MIAGRNSAVAISMMNSVSRLEDASQTVKLLLGSSEDGMSNGNSEMPAVPMIPAIESELATMPSEPRP